MQFVAKGFKVLSLVVLFHWSASNCPSAVTRRLLELAGLATFLSSIGSAITIAAEVAGSPGWLPCYIMMNGRRRC